MAAAVFLVNYFLIELIHGISHEKLNFFFVDIPRFSQISVYFKRETAKVLLNIK
jgi:hypothetical protein